jgi:transcriptional repressor NrdR
MKCPYCQSSETRVTDSRESNDNIRRRRECIGCNKRFTTYERIEELVVLKKNGRKEKFDRDKLLKGIMKSCEKRSIEEQQVENLVNEIEAEIRLQGKEIKSSIIGDSVIDKLKKLDSVAYMRFASVYRGFENLSEFEKELKAFTKRRKNGQ